METNKTTVYAGMIMMLLVGIGLALGMTNDRGLSDGQHMMPGGRMMENARMSAADQHFIIQMIPHHEGAIEMARLALERSKRPEVLSLSQGIIEAQEREIANMKEWYADWYDSAPPQGGMGMHMGGMTGDLDALRGSTETDFDRLFLKQMILHHEMAIMMAQMIVSSERSEMRQLAADITSSQSCEIEMMRGWLKTWYPAR